MAKQVINIGAGPDAGDGEPLRDAFDKVNDNFTEVYDGQARTFAHLTFASLTVATATLYQIADADVVVVADAAGIWETANDRLHFTSGILGANFTRARIYLRVGLPGSATQLGVHMRKNGAISGGSTAPPVHWGHIGDAAEISGMYSDSYALLHEVDALAAADKYTFHVRHEAGSTQDLVGEIFVEMLP